MKNKIKNSFIIASLFLLLTSCNTKNIIRDFYSFGTFCSYDIYLGADKAMEIDDYVNKINMLTDNFQSYNEINNVYTINNSTDYVEVDEDLINILKRAVELQEETNGMFNPLCGSLSSYAKECIEENKEPVQNNIDAIVKNMNASSLSFEENKVRILGSAKLDLGGIVKGYVLENIYKNYKFNNSTYVFDFGHSSLMLGEPSSAKEYNIHYQNYLTFKASNCAVSTSSIDEQYIEINDTIYSHIVNTTNGSFTPKYQSVIIKGKREDGAMLDAFSTVAMNLTLDGIKEYESKYDLEFIIIKDDKLFYESEK